MNLRIGHKMFLAMLATTGLGIASMAIAQRYSFERGLLNYVQEIEFERLEALTDELGTRYATEGSWAFIAGNENLPTEFIRFARRDRRPPNDDFALIRGMSSKPINSARADDKARREPKLPHVLPLWQRISLLDAQGQWVAGAVIAELGVEREIFVHGELVGFMRLAPLEHLSDELDLAFARQQLGYLVWAAIAVLIGTALAAALMARSFGQPIRAIARGTHELAGGRYDARLQMDRSDELGRLAADFNRLAEALQNAQQDRRQWVADTSHELRTPVSILRGELESLEAGMRPLDNSALQSLSVEVKRLNGLIDDLHQLAQSDSGAFTFKRTPVDLGRLIEETEGRFRDRANTADLTINLDIDSLEPVLGDQDRLGQLLDNLMENALRYTDPGGEVHVVAKVLNSQIHVAVADSGPGVPDEALPRLFDRLYRVEASRNRDYGASGLGLAICESIVKAHGGTICAAHSDFGGLLICVVLPLQNDEV